LEEEAKAVRLYPIRNSELRGRGKSMKLTGVID
jgi:hypothetical protein